MRDPVDRYVAALLRKKRPKPFAPTQNDVRMVAAAISLTAGATGGTDPRPTFVELLRERIENRQYVAPSPEPRPAWRIPARRRFLVAGALTVTGVAVGSAGTHLLAAGALAAPATASPEPDDLMPTPGAWQAVADSGQLPEGAVLPFALGPITGFVRRAAGQVQAVSGICTHQGCRLDLTAARDRLACPCHGATFSLAGAELSRPRLMKHALPALPHLPVREQNGRIEVYASAAATDAGTVIDTEPAA